GGRASERALRGCGRGGQVDRERRSLAGVVRAGAHRDGARGIDVERGVGGDVPAAAAVGGGGERQGAQVAAAVPGIDREAVLALGRVERDAADVHGEGVGVPDRRVHVGGRTRIQNPAGRAGGQRQALRGGGRRSAGAAAVDRPGCIGGATCDGETDDSRRGEAHETFPIHGILLRRGEGSPPAPRRGADVLLADRPGTDRCADHAPDPGTVFPHRLVRYFRTLLTDTNPFIYSHPIAPDDVIDRDAETGQLLAAAVGGHFVRLYAPRKYGKTSLLRRVLRDAERRERMIPILVDLYGVLSIADVAIRFERAYARQLKGKARARIEEFLQ